MSFDLTEDTKVHTIWFAQMDGANFMGMLYQPPGEKWVFRYRIRAFVDDKVFNSEDRRSWYSAEIDPAVPLDAVARQISGVLPHLATLPGARIAPPLHVNGNGLKAVELLGEQDWAHIGDESGAAS